MKFLEKDGKVGVEANLCLGVKENGGLIEEVFTDKLKTGFFHDLKVMSEGAEFKPKGQCIMTKRLKCLPCRSFCYLIMWIRNTPDLKYSLSVHHTEVNSTR